MEKRTLRLLITLIIVVLVVPSVLAEDVICFDVRNFDGMIIMNEKEMKFELPVVAIDGSIYVPLREAAKKANLDIKWNGDEQKVVLKENSQNINVFSSIGLFEEKALPETAKIINFDYFTEGEENYVKAKISFKKEDLQVIKSCFDDWMKDDGRFLHQYNKECSWWQLTDINEALYAYSTFKRGVKVKTIEMYAYIVENGNDEYILYLVN